MTIAAFAAKWNALFPRPDPRTNANNKGMIRPFVERFGPREFASITKMEAHEWGMEHPNRVRYARTLYYDAIRAGVAEESPFTGLRLSNGSSIGRTYDELPTYEQVAALEAAAPEPIAGMITFAAYTGLRLGEQLGLRRTDFDGDTILVASQLDPSGRRKPCKGRSGSRRVFVCPEASDAVSGLLRAHGGLLWPIHRRTHFKCWDAARKAVGAEFPWHVLRHAALNRWVERGASTRDVAYLAGHRDDRLIRELYGRHVDENAAVERLRELA